MVGVRVVIMIGVGVLGWVEKVRVRVAGTNALLPGLGLGSGLGLELGLDLGLRLGLGFGLGLGLGSGLG